VEGRPGAKPLVIGSDPSCDWPIRAAGVPGQALYLLIDERGAYVHSGLEGKVRMNGRRLGGAWRRVRSGARFDIGLAQLEIELHEERFVPRGPDRAPHDPAGLPDQMLGSDPDASGVRQSFLPRPIIMPARKRWWRTGRSRNSLPEAASVLGKAPRKSLRVWYYAFVAAATASAYIGWLLLLDS
jgi:hypothetical protein